MNNLPLAKKVQIINLLVEGNSLDQRHVLPDVPLTPLLSC